MEKKKKENVFRTLARWFVRWFFSPKYEEKWFLNKDKDDEKEEKTVTFKNGVPDDSELIVSPGRQIFNRFMERKFAVFSVIVVLIMFLTVFIAPHFMTKYSDSFTETTQQNLPPNLSMMSVPGELKDNIKMIDSYSSFTVGLSNDGKVYVWGVGSIGATGVNIMNIPEEVKNAKIAYVAAGHDHIIAIGEDGKLYGWGSNRFGQYAPKDANAPEEEVNPELEALLESEGAEAGGEQETADAGEAGSEEKSKMVDSNNIAPIPEAVLNGLDVNEIKKVTCGYQSTAILMKDGTLYLWSNKNAYKKMDDLIRESQKTKFVDIDFTLSAVVALPESRTKLMTGEKTRNQKTKKYIEQYHLVRTSFSGTETQELADFLGDRLINEIRTTSDGICILLDDGSIAFFGNFNRKDTVNVPALAEGEYFVDIEGGTYHFTGLTNLGHVYSFGDDHYGQATAPKVEGAAKVFAGAFQNYAVDANGKLLETWGLKGYLFGTDEAGANILERVVAGGKVTMTVGAIAVIIEILIGVSIGLAAGFAGGWVDIFLMRVAEVFSSIPLYPFMLILSSLLTQVNITPEQRLYMIMVILGFLGWPGFAYITRAQVLVARESEYVTAAQAMGVKPSRIAFKHILPNIVSVILVNMTLSFAASMQTETSLSFLGFGVNYPQPSWGNMLARASNATAALNFWWQWVFTASILILTTVCINTIGDTLRDVMDPKSTNDK